MQINIVQCYRSRLKTKGYTEIHIRKLSELDYFVECVYLGSFISAVVTVSQMSVLSTVPDASIWSVTSA
jgi:hypothetical protein